MFFIILFNLLSLYGMSKTPIIRNDGIKQNNNLDEDHKINFLCEKYKLIYNTNLDFLKYMNSNEELKKKYNQFITIKENNNELYRILFTCSITYLKFFLNNKNIFLIEKIKSDDDLANSTENNDADIFEEFNDLLNIKKNISYLSDKNQENINKFFIGDTCPEVDTPILHELKCIENLFENCKNTINKIKENSINIKENKNTGSKDIFEKYKIYLKEMAINKIEEFYYNNEKNFAQKKIDFSELKKSLGYYSTKKSSNSKETNEKPKNPIIDPTETTVSPTNHNSIEKSISPIEEQSISENSIVKTEKPKKLISINNNKMIYLLINSLIATTLITFAFLFYKYIINMPLFNKIIIDKLNKSSIIKNNLV